MRKGGGTRTALYNYLAFCLALVMGLSRWFMQQLQCRPGAEMWESHPCCKDESKYLARSVLPLSPVLFYAKLGLKIIVLFDTGFVIPTGNW